jgi:hypothetical protein
MREISFLTISLDLSRTLARDRFNSAAALVIVSRADRACPTIPRWIAFIESNVGIGQTSIVNTMETALFQNGSLNRKRKNVFPDVPRPVAIVNN